MINYGYKLTNSNFKNMNIMTIFFHLDNRENRILENTDPFYDKKALNDWK